MGLFAYRQQTQRYLDDQTQALHNPADLNVWINEARLQIALGSECLRQPATVAITAGQQSYAFADMTFVAAPTIPAGLGGVGNVRMARLLLLSGGYQRIQMRAWEWFETYYLDVAISVPGPPAVASRLQPGISGTLWFAPVPDDTYTVTVDTVAYPAPLATDADSDALPVPWQDAVPFFAAHLALISVGDAQGAAEMWERYQTFERRSVQITTPSRIPRRYPGGAGAVGASQHAPLTGMPVAGRR